MSLLKKIANINKYERGQNYELGHSLSSTAVTNMFGTGGNAINVIEEYNGFAWKCINIRAEMLSAQDLFVERLVGGKWSKDDKHEFNDILEGGDGSLDQSELLDAWSKSLDLYGEAFWYYSKAESANKPFAVYPLDPSAMTIFVASNRITGFAYQQEDGQKILLDLDEVDYWRISRPGSQFRGMGPMQAAGWFVRSARYVNTYINNFLENNAIPAGVVVAKGQVDDADWQLFKEQWAAKYSGIDNAGKTGYIRGSDLEFVKTGLSLGEVDFEKMKNTSRDDVMVMFGISKPMMAIFDDINRASATVARQLFAISFTEPALRKLKRKTSKKVANWYGDGFRIGSTDPVPEDDDVRITRLEKGTNRWITVNEARIADGLEPLGPEYDVIQLQASTIAPVAPKSIGKVTIRTKNNKASFDYQMKESFRGEMENLQVKYEQQFFQAANPILKKQRDRVLDQLQPKKLATATFDPDEEAKKLADAALPLFILLANEQGALATSFAGNADMDFKLTPVMEKYIADSLAKSSLSFTVETQEAIVKAIADGLNDGQSIAKIAKRINELYDDVLGVKTPGYRIERLVRTEVIKTSNEITEAAYKQTGVVQKKEWFANPGRCEFCASLNGSIIRLGGVYVPKGSSIEGVNGGTRSNTYEDVKHPPVHPACRCTLIPVIED